MAQNAGYNEQAGVHHHVPEEELPQFRCMICGLVVFNRWLLVKKCDCCNDNLVHKSCINGFLMRNLLYTFPGCESPILTLSYIQCFLIAVDRMQHVQLFLFVINSLISGFNIGRIINAANFMVFALKYICQQAQLPQEAAWVQIYGFCMAMEVPYYMVTLHPRRLAAVTEVLFELQSIKLALWIVHHFAVKAGGRVLSERSQLLRNLRRSRITRNLLRISFLNMFFLYTSTNMVAELVDHETYEKLLNKRLNSISIAGPDVLITNYF